MLETLEKKFTQEGFVVLKAQNGEEGLRVALKEHPDLILLDIIMPVMGGMEMLGELRLDVWGKKVPVILLTNLNEPLMKNPLIVGENDYIVKANWSIENIVKTVKEKLGIDFNSKRLDT